MKDIEREKKSNELRVRDQKQNYLRKMYNIKIMIYMISHRIIFELEKRKVIEEKKHFMEERKVKNE
jgi:hypothetical protein